MPHRARSAASALGVALALTLWLTLGASAQVATLVGPDATPTPEPQAATEVGLADREEALLAYAQCMRENGVEMDDPQPGQAGGRFLRPGGRRGMDELDEEFRLAREACAPILVAARPEIDPEVQQELLEQQLAMAQCIRENGYPGFPDPAIDSSGRMQRLVGQFDELGIDRRSEAFTSVRQACAEALDIEAFGPGGGPAGRARGGDG